MSTLVTSISRYVRLSPTKVRPITASIVNKPALEAVDILRYIPKKGARAMIKTLKSAIANAENNHNLSSANLFVAEAHVDDAPAIKRFLPASKGRAMPIKKRNSHIRIVLSDVAKPARLTKRQQDKVKKAATTKKEETK